MKNEFDYTPEPLNKEEASQAAKDESEASAWLDEVTSAEKREHKWRQSGRDVIKLYEADKKCDYQFNILYSNTETLAPALYSTTPTPVVQRRFKDEDPMGMQCSKVIQRTLAYSIDDGQAVYATFDSLMVASVVSALVPGRGVVRFKYDPEFVQIPIKDDPEDSESIDSRPERQFVPPAATEELKWESVCGELIPWDRFCHGYGSTWQDVPWVAFKWPMTQAELKKNFGAEIGMKVELASVSEAEVDGEKDHSTDMMKGMKIAWVYEIWNKATREVIFITEGYKEGPLKKVEDPLGLTGFFPCPQPLTFFQRISSLLPQTLYSFYEEQAKELNQVTARIGRLTKALKVRGIYDGSIDALGRIFEQDDNALLAADNTAAMYDRGGLEKAIWLLPIDKIITVLQQLYINRQQSKQVIYEITGLSDILRGTSNPNETLGAQKIKDQWGNLRLRKLQKRVQTYVVDGLRIMAEIACGKFALDTLKGMTNLQYPSMQEKQALQMSLQTQPPQDPAQLEMIKKALAVPSWEEIDQVLKNDLQRAYRIDIETNSTIEPEATEDKESMMNLMNALSQFLIGIQPLVENGSMPFEAMKAMMLTICRRFNFGDQVEDELKKMQEPAPQEQEVDPAIEQAKKQIEQDGQKLMQEKQKFEQDKMAFDNQVKQKEMEIQNEEKETLMEIGFAKKEALLEIKMSEKEAQLNVAGQVQTAQMGLQSEATRTNLEHGAKEESLGKKEAEISTKEAEGKAKAEESESKHEAKQDEVINTLKEGHSVLADAMTKMAEGLAQMAKAQSAPRTISDGIKSFTVKSGE